MEKEFLDKLNIFSENFDNLFQRLETGFDSLDEFSFNSPSVSTKPLAVKIQNFESENENDIKNHKVDNPILKEFESPKIYIDGLNLKTLYINIVKEFNVLKKHIWENVKDLKKMKEDKKYYLETIEEKNKELKELKAKNQTNDYVENLEMEIKRLKNENEAFHVNTKITESYVINEIIIKTEKGKISNSKDNIYLKSLNNPENSFLKDKDREERISEDNIKEMINTMNENEKNEKDQLTAEKAQLENDFLLYKENIDQIKNVWISEKSTHKQILLTLEKNQQKLCNTIFKGHQKNSALKQEIETLFLKLKEREVILSNTIKQNTNLKRKLGMEKKEHNFLKNGKEFLERQNKNLCRTKEKLISENKILQEDLSIKFEKFVEENKIKNKILQNLEEKIKNLEKNEERSLYEHNEYLKSSKEQIKNLEQNSINLINEHEKKNKEINELIVEQQEKIQNLEEKNLKLKKEKEDTQKNANQEIYDIKSKSKELNQLGETLNYNLIGLQKEKEELNKKIQNFQEIEKNNLNENAKKINDLINENNQKDIGLKLQFSENEKLKEGIHNNNIVIEKLKENIKTSEEIQKFSNEDYTNKLKDFKEEIKNNINQLKLKELENEDLIQLFKKSVENKELIQNNYEKSQKQIENLKKSFEFEKKNLLEKIKNYEKNLLELKKENQENLKTLSEYLTNFIENFLNSEKGHNLTIKLLRENLLNSKNENEKTVKLLNENLINLQKEKKRKIRLLNQNLLNLKRLNEETVNLLNENLKKLEKEKDTKIKLLSDNLILLKSETDQMLEKLKENLKNLKSESETKIKLLDENFETMKNENDRTVKLLNENLINLQEESKAKIKILNQNLINLKNENEQIVKILKENLKNAEIENQSLIEKIKKIEQKEINITNNFNQIIKDLKDNTNKIMNSQLSQIENLSQEIKSSEQHRINELIKNQQKEKENLQSQKEQLKNLQLEMNNQNEKKSEEIQVKNKIIDSQKKQIQDNEEKFVRISESFSILEKEKTDNFQNFQSEKNEFLLEIENLNKTITFQIKEINEILVKTSENFKLNEQNEVKLINKINELKEEILTIKASFKSYVSNTNHFLSILALSFQNMLEKIKKINYEKRIDEIDNLTKCLAQEIDILNLKNIENSFLKLFESFQNQYSSLETQLNLSQVLNKDLNTVILASENQFSSLIALFEIHKHNFEKKIKIFHTKNEKSFQFIAKKLSHMEQKLKIFSSKKFWQSFFKEKVNNFDFLSSIFMKIKNNKKQPFNELFYHFSTNLLFHSHNMNYSDLIARLYKGMLIFIELLKMLSIVLKSIMIDIDSNNKQDNKIIILFVDYINILENINEGIEKTFKENQETSKSNIENQIKIFQILIEAFFGLIDKSSFIRKGLFDLGKEILKRIHNAIEEKSLQMIGNVFEKAKSEEKENFILKNELLKMKSEIQMLKNQSKQ